MPNLRYFLEPQPGLHAGRHRGLKESAGDVLVYVDDDVRALPEWLSTLADVFSDPQVAMAGGNNYPDFLGPVPRWLEKLWLKSVDGRQMIGHLSILSMPGGRREISPLLVWGCNFSIRRQVLLDAGGFHPDAMPRDLMRFRGDGETHVSRYVQDNRLRCMFDSRASVYHAVTPERMTIDYFRQRAFNQGISNSYTVLRNSVRLQRTASWFLLNRCRLRMGFRNLIGRFVEDPMFAEVNKALREGYVEGIEYHRRLYFADPEVREWLRRADYF